MNNVAIGFDKDQGNLYICSNDECGKLCYAPIVYESQGSESPKYCCICTKNLSKLSYCSLCKNRSK